MRLAPLAIIALVACGGSTPPSSAPATGPAVSTAAPAATGTTARADEPTIPSSRSGRHSADREQLLPFIDRFDAAAADPEAVIQLLIEALVTLERDEQLGTDMLHTVVSKNMNTREYVRLLLANPNIARSYAGGTHQNDYADFDPNDVKVVLDKNYASSNQGIGYPSEGKAKFFVASGGADSPRPVTLSLNGSGQWKVTEMSSLAMGVRKPASEAGDF